MSSLSILPAHYDMTFLIEQTGVENHYGYEAKEDGIHFRYLVDDYDAVQAAIDAYPTAYLAISRPLRLTEVSYYRDQRINSFSFGGMTIPLNLETRTNLAGAVVGLERSDINEIDWSLGQGQFVTLTRGTMFALADAAFAHVQACFSAQRVIVAEIMAAQNIDELAAIDVANHEAWPST